MGLKYANNAKTTLNGAHNDSTTTITVVDGSVFPSLGAGDYFYMTLEDVSLNNEIVKVTARSTNTLTVVRAQNGTTAKSFSTADKAEGRIVAAVLDDLFDITANMKAFLADPTSAKLRAAVTDETGSGVLVFNISPSFTGTAALSQTTSGLTYTDAALRLESTDAGANGPVLTLYHNSASPAVSDIIRPFRAYFNDSGGTPQLMAGMNVVTENVTAGAWVTNISFFTGTAGSASTKLLLGQGLYTNGVTGGDKGLGSGNFDSLYVADDPVMTRGAAETVTGAKLFSATQNTGTVGAAVIGTRMFGHIHVQATDAYSTQKGGLITFGGEYNSSGNLQSTYGAIRGKKHNATNANSGGGLELLYTNNSTGTMAVGLSIDGFGILTAYAGAVIGGGRTFHNAVSEPYAVAARYVSTGGAVYFGASDGTATPNAVISNASGSAIITALNSRAVRFDNYGAGTLVTDSSGNITASSDEELKYITGQFTRGLIDLRAMDRPVSYQWRNEQIELAEATDAVSDTKAKLIEAQAAFAITAKAAQKKTSTEEAQEEHRASERVVMQLSNLLADQQHRASLTREATTYTGWTAQGVRKGIPEAVKAGPDGLLNFDERPLMAAMYNAILEMADRIEALENAA